MRGRLARVPASHLQSKSFSHSHSPCDRAPNLPIILSPSPSLSSTARLSPTEPPYSSRGHRDISPRISRSIAASPTAHPAQPSPSARTPTPAALRSAQGRSPRIVRTLSRPLGRPVGVPDVANTTARTTASISLSRAFFSPSSPAPRVFRAAQTRRSPSRAHHCRYTPASKL